MRTSTVVIGLLGGVLLSGALGPALFVSLPARFVNDWFYASPEMALGGFVGALALTALVGFFASAFQPEDAVRSGTIAGLVAAILAGVLVVLPASEIEALGSLLDPLLFRNTPTAELAQVTAAAALRGTWVPAMTGFALLCAGPSLGAMGGVVYDLWRGSVSRTSRMIRLSVLPVVGLVLVCLAETAATIWIVHLDLTVLPALGRPLGFGDRNLLTSPHLVAGAFNALFAAWVVRDAILSYREGSRLFGLWWLLLAVSGPTATLLIVLSLHPMAALTVSPWVGAIASMVAVITSAVLAGRSELIFERTHRGLTHVLGEAVIAATTLVGVGLFVFGASVLGTYRLAFPYVRALLGTAGMMEVDPGPIVMSLFIWHWALVPGLIAATVVYFAGAGPIWVLRRLIRGG